MGGVGLEKRVADGFSLKTVRVIKGGQNWKRTRGGVRGGKGGLVGSQKMLKESKGGVLTCNLMRGFVVGTAKKGGKRKTASIRLLHVDKNLGEGAGWKIGKRGR